MYERDWRNFLLKGHGKEIAIAQLSAKMVEHLGASSHFVYLHHDYAVKAVLKHTIHPADLALIFDTVERGTAVADRPLHITFYMRAGWERWLQVTVKRAFESRRIYVATFYKLRERDALKRMTRGELLRP
jgi:hypothetical protein